MRQAQNEIRFIRNHEAASGRSTARFIEWQLRCLAGQSATVELPLYGVQCWLPPDRRGTSKLLFAFREHYEAELAELRSFVRPGDHVLDVGAHFGAYTISLATIVGEYGSVTALEPASYAYAVLEKNIELNKQTNVTLIQAAAGNRKGTAAFGLARDPSRSSLVVKDGRSESVKIDCLDNLVKRRPISFVKIDVEGAEPLAFLGASDILANDRPIIQLEVTPDAGRIYGYKSTLLWELLVDRFGYQLWKNSHCLSSLPDYLTNIYAIHPGGPQPLGGERVGPGRSGKADA